MLISDMEKTTAGKRDTGVILNRVRGKGLTEKVVYKQRPDREVRG